MTIRPLHDNVLIALDKPAEKQGSLYVPTAGQAAPDTGEVIAIGHGLRLPDGQLRELDVRVGERVQLAQYAGVKLDRTTDDGRELVMVAETSIQAVLL